MKIMGILAVSFFVLLIVSESAYGQYNVIIGDYAGHSCNTCSNDVLIGVDAGYFDWATSWNTYVGSGAGAGDLPACPGDNCYSGASHNTFIGGNSGYNNNGGGNNVYVGNEAGYGSTAPISPTYNTFVGDSAGHSISSGAANAFLGYNTGYWTTEGSSNTFLGSSAGFSSNGNGNTFVGSSAGYSNNGSRNVFIGANAGDYDQTGSNLLYIDNCYWKDGSGHCTKPLIKGDFYNKTLTIDGTLTTTGGIHFADGSTQISGLSGVSNANATFLGQYAGRVTTASDDTFVGNGAGYSNTSGYANNFFGYHAGYFNTSGYVNSFFGYNAGFLNNIGNSNSFFGNGAGYSNTGGSYNTFIGATAGSSNDMGNYNSVLGYRAGSSTKGDGNTFLGYQAGYSNVTGHGNVFIGHDAGYSETQSDRLYIDNCHDGGSCTNPLIYGKFDTRLVQINGELIMSSALSPSDQRLKKNIEPLTFSLDKVMHLQGVSYEWREEETAGRGFDKDRQIGLIAQDVESIIPELVHTDSQGYKALDYDKMIPVLIEAIKELQKRNEKLEQRLLALEAK